MLAQSRNLPARPHHLVPLRTFRQASPERSPYLVPYPNLPSPSPWHKRTLYHPSPTQSNPTTLQLQRFFADWSSSPVNRCAHPPVLIPSHHSLQSPGRQKLRRRAFCSLLYHRHCRLSHAGFTTLLMGPPTRFFRVVGLLLYHVCRPSVNHLQPKNCTKIQISTYHDSTTSIGLPPHWVVTANTEYNRVNNPASAPCI